jgi:hypothetical protein
MDRAEDRFKKWYQRENLPIAIMTPCKEAFIQGDKEGRLDLVDRLSECQTFEEMMHLLRQECDLIERGE